MDEIQPNPSRGIISAGIILLVALLVTTLYILVPFRHALRGDAIYYLSRLLFWACLGLMIFYSTKIEKQPFLLWQEKKYPFSFYVIAFIAIMSTLYFGSAVLGLIVRALKWQGNTTKYVKTIALFKADKVLLVFTCITAGVVEELLFRGYLMTRLELLLKKPWLSIIISSALFGAMHFGWGNVPQVLGPFFIGWVFATFYYYYRNIKLLIFCHFLWDLMLLLIGVYVKHKYK